MDMKINADCGDTVSECPGNKESDSSDTKEDSFKEASDFGQELHGLDDTETNFEANQDDEDQPGEMFEIEPRNELRNMLNDFQLLCNAQFGRITDYASTFGGDGREQFRPNQPKKPKKTKHRKPNMYKSLIMICMMIVLLMQIHMYILLYSKFNRVHREIRALACVTYGKNCPDSHTAYQCITNKIDFMDVEHSRSMELLQKDMEDMTKAMHNMSHIVFLQNYVEEDKPPNKPPRTGSVYPVNP